MSLIDYDRGMPKPFPPNFEPNNTMGDDEFAVQMAKIFIGCVIGFIALFILYHQFMAEKRMEQQLIKINQYLDNRLNYE